jgi:hypothetical protein
VLVVEFSRLIYVVYAVNLTLNNGIKYGTSSVIATKVPDPTAQGYGVSALFHEHGHVPLQNGVALLVRVDCIASEVNTTLCCGGAVRDTRG